MFLMLPFSSWKQTAIQVTEITCRVSGRNSCFFLSHQTRKCAFDRIIITCSQQQQKGFLVPVKLLCGHPVAFFRVLSLSLLVSLLKWKPGALMAGRSHCTGASCRCSVSHLCHYQSCLCISTVTAAACHHSPCAGTAPNC